MQEISREEFQSHLDDDKKQFALILEKLDKVLLWQENIKFSWKALLGLLGIVGTLVGLILGIGKLLK